MDPRGHDALARVEFQPFGDHAPSVRGRIVAVSAGRRPTGSIGVGVKEDNRHEGLVHHRGSSRNGQVVHPRALAAGDRVVATARRPEEIAASFGDDDGLLAVRLDVTSVDDAGAAVEAAMHRFGRIDVVVNNAGASFKGYFVDVAAPGGTAAGDESARADERDEGRAPGDARAT